MTNLTAPKFAALASLTSVRATPSLDAARLVMVEGLGASEAARQVGVTRQQVGNVLSRLRAALRLAREIAG